MTTTRSPQQPSAQHDNRLRQFRKTSCHELGHTLGLRRYTYLYQRFDSGGTGYYRLSCQRSGWTGHITDDWIRTWEQHHIQDHIRTWFA